MKLCFAIIVTLFLYSSIYSIHAITLYIVAVEGDASSIPTLNPSSSTGFTLSKQALERQQALAAAKANNEHDDDNNNDDDDDDDDSDSSNDSSSDNNSDSDDSDSDDDDDEEDDTEKLMAELEKIKRERAEERERLEREREEAEEEARLREAVTGNPLLAGDGSGAGGASSSSRDFSVKRRWDDDVIFKNQVRIFKAIKVLFSLLLHSFRFIFFLKG